MKIIKSLVFVFSLPFLYGCYDQPQPPENITEKYTLPHELEAKGCKVYLLDRGISNIKVVYCPNAQVTTSYTQGKSKKNTTVIAE